MITPASARNRRKATMKRRRNPIRHQTEEFRKFMFKVDRTIRPIKFIKKGIVTKPALDITFLQSIVNFCVILCKI